MSERTFHVTFSFHLITMEKIKNEKTADGRTSNRKEKNFIGDEKKSQKTNA